MASASRRGVAGKRRGKRARSSGAGILWLFFAVAVPASVVALPTVLVLAAGMVPSMVALVVDRAPNRTAGITVGSLNLCGVMPFLLELWSQPHHKLPQALQLLDQLVGLDRLIDAMGVDFLAGRGRPVIFVGGDGLERKRPEGTVERVYGMNADIGLAIAAAAHRDSRPFPRTPR